MSSANHQYSIGLKQLADDSKAVGRGSLVVKSVWRLLAACFASWLALPLPRT